ncbi:hypothetical protein OXT66_04320 [Lentilactobacillus senioris]|uniref:hypothetical protein n=1 Tax=Lentilactobacillus senioris TaxID=931534 RepID=UPI0022830ABC|nr:hypothetical protein [Lentilactobacillus senioris]MCY9806772.1 hypothetical protein [Lentilactobacillus senioris]
MQLFKISFINKIKPETVEIAYVATLEGTKSAPIFEGRQLFYRDNIDAKSLKNGSVAIKAILNILSVTSPDLILDRVLLNQSQDKNILNAMSKQSFDEALTNHQLLNRLKTHLDDNKQTIIDTEIITETRIG